MLLLNCLSAIVFLFVIPAFVGNIWASTDKREGRLAFLWVSGQITLWAGFQLFAVVCVFLNKSFTALTYGFALFEIGMIFVALGSFLQRKNRLRMRIRQAAPRARFSLIEILGWVIFLGIMAFITYQTVTMTYADGDNAYYLATASITRSSDTMYRILPYTGLYTGLDVRHALAPFPIWIAYLSKVTGFHVATVAHVVFPIALIWMFFQLIYLMGLTLLQDKKKYIPLLLIFSQILLLFGDYSIYSTENFLLARTAQGKAVLGALIIPFLFWICLQMFFYLEEGKAIPISYYGMLQVTLIAGCLCSALSSFLLILFIGVVALCMLFAYKSIRQFLWFGCSSIIPLLFAGIYFMSK